MLAVTKAQRLGFCRVGDRVTELPPTAWQRLSAGDGAKGPRLYDWAHLPCGSDAAPGWEKGLLTRRSLAEPGKLAFYLTHAVPTAWRWRIWSGSPARAGRSGLLRGGQGRGRSRPVRGPLPATVS